MDFLFNNDRPIYVQLIEQLKIMIISGQLESGKKIPSVRELASTAQVNPNTVQKALQELENLELIQTERTNGKFVTKDVKKIESLKKELAKEKAQKFLAEMKKLGLSKSETIHYLQEMEQKNGTIRM